MGPDETALPAIAVARIDEIAPLMGVLITIPLAAAVSDVTHFCEDCRA